MPSLAQKSINCSTPQKKAEVSRESEVGTAKGCSQIPNDRKMATGKLLRDRNGTVVGAYQSPKQGNHVDKSVERLMLALVDIFDDLDEGQPLSDRKPLSTKPVIGGRGKRKRIH